MAEEAGSKPEDIFNMFEPVKSMSEVVGHNVVIYSKNATSGGRYGQAIKIELSMEDGVKITVTTTSKVVMEQLNNNSISFPFKAKVSQKKSGSGYNYFMLEAPG